MASLFLSLVSPHFPLQVPLPFPPLFWSLLFVRISYHFIPFTPIWALQPFVLRLVPLFVAITLEEPLLQFPIAVRVLQQVE